MQAQKDELSAKIAKTWKRRYHCHFLVYLSFNKIRRGTARKQHYPLGVKSDRNVCTLLELVHIEVRYRVEGQGETERDADRGTERQKEAEKSRERQRETEGDRDRETDRDR